MTIMSTNYRIATRHQGQRFYVLSRLAILSVMGLLLTSNACGEHVRHYNVVWDSPSADASGQMPLGNGDIAAGVYAIEDGDLYLLLSKNEALTYNGDIFKTGRVKISVNPNPFAKGKPFTQTLDLASGSIRIEADGISLRIWADAMRPVYHVQIDSPDVISVRAESNLWERMDGCDWNRTKEPIDEPTQDVRLERDATIQWYFPVGDRSVYPTELAFYDRTDWRGARLRKSRHDGRVQATQNAGGEKRR